MDCLCQKEFVKVFQKGWWEMVMMVELCQMEQQVVQVGLEWSCLEEQVVQHWDWRQERNQPQPPAKSKLRLVREGLKDLQAFEDLEKALED